MSYLRLIVLLFVTIYICPQSKANDTYNIRQINNRDGLSNSSVICLFQDSDHFHISFFCTGIHFPLLMTSLQLE